MLRLLLLNALCAASVERGFGPALHQKVASLDAAVGPPGGVLYGVEIIFFGVCQAKCSNKEQGLPKAGKSTGNTRKRHCASLTGTNSLQISRH